MIMNVEMERRWEEVALACLIYYPTVTWKDQGKM
jgi:hypothetical protein